MRGIKICIMSLGLALLTWACAPWWRHTQPELEADVGQTAMVVEEQVSKSNDLRCHQRDARVFDVALVLYQRGLGEFDEALFDIADLVIQKADEHTVPASLILAVMEEESRFDHCALSHHGAKGLMQVIPERILGEDHIRETYGFQRHVFYDPTWNVTQGSDYLGKMLDRFGNIEYALAAYHQGPTRLSRRLRKQTYRGSGYVRRVLKREAVFQEWVL